MDGAPSSKPTDLECGSLPYKAAASCRTPRRLRRIPILCEGSDAMLRLLLPVLTGLLLAASFPRADQGYLAWIAFIPLITFTLKAKTWTRAFLGGFLAWIIAVFALMIWIPTVLARYGGLSTPLAWIAFGFMIALLACYPAAACGLVGHLVKRGGDGFILLFPAIWVSMEYVQSFSPFGGFPWLLAGYTQSEFLSLIQISDIAGVYGVSFLLVWTGTAIVWFVFRKGVGRIAFAPLLAALLLIAASLMYGRISLRHWDGSDATHRAAILQGNISYEDPESVLDAMFRRGYVQMAEKLGSKGADLLILPESPTPIAFDYDSSYRSILETLAGRFPLGLIFNNVRSAETGAGWRYFNSAYFLDGTGSLSGIYDKMHLVPFGEYIPLKSLFFFFETITKDAGEFYPGKEYKIVKVGARPANAILCFEAVFPDLVRRFVLGGSRLIVNLTNDGWYGDSSAPYQHFAIARFRAVENRRYLIRAANTGISAVIEPSGKIQSSTGLLQEAVCEGRFAFLEKQTIYTRYGNVLVFLCAIISCASWILTAFIKR
jgi:apolipoprotein N-acyltransferase